MLNAHGGTDFTDRIFLPRSRQSRKRWKPSPITLSIAQPEESLFRTIWNLGFLFVLELFEFQNLSIEAEDFANEGLNASGILIPEIKENLRFSDGKRRLLAELSG